ncbi:hypothetical protein HanIR_Chr03g0116631 [Helianthus annuus]|nr:hypothetical protein HanIR_Chr03g0116631 [Helianthus annuus]
MRYKCLLYQLTYSDFISFLTHIEIIFFLMGQFMFDMNRKSVLYKQVQGKVLEITISG